MGTRNGSVMMWLALGLILVVHTPTSLAVAQEPGEAGPANDTAAESTRETPPSTLPEPWYKTPTKNHFVASLGLAIWPSLGDKEFGTTTATTNPGSVNSVGGAIRGAYERHIAHWDHGDLYLGAEWGGFKFFNDQESLPTQPSTGTPGKGVLESVMWYAGPSMKFMIGEGRLKYFLGGGVGYYSLSLSEFDYVPPPACTTITCTRTQRETTKSAIGGHVSLGIDLAAFRTESGWQWKFRLEDDIHLVNYGSLDNFSRGVGSLSGPINVIQFGVIAGF